MRFRIRSDIRGCRLDGSSWLPAAFCLSSRTDSGVSRYARIVAIPLLRSAVTLPTDAFLAAPVIDRPRLPPGPHHPLQESTGSTICGTLGSADDCLQHPVFFILFQPKNSTCRRRAPSRRTLLRNVCATQTAMHRSALTRLWVW